MADISAVPVGLFRIESNSATNIHILYNNTKSLQNILQNNILLRYNINYLRIFILINKH